MADEIEIGERKASIVSNSPDHANEKENPEEQNQGDIGNAESIPTDWKVWTEEETRNLIQLYKSCSSKYPENYSRKLLFQEIAQDLRKMGCMKDPERIRNRMKSLRTAYRRTMEYNATHILKKNFAYLDDLNEIYKATPSLSDDNDTSNHSGYSMSIGKDEDSYSIASSNGSAKKVRIVRTSKTVEPNVEVLGNSKPATSSTPRYTSLRRKIPSKKAIFPLFQCGQCYGKFSTSQELHNHNCQSPSETPKVNGMKQNATQKKKNGTTSQNKVAFEILLKPTANAPILKDKRWCVRATYKIADVMQCVRKALKLDSSVSLFLYVNQAFAPCPDDEIGNVYRCFNLNGRLVLHYSTSVAWG